MRKLVFVLPFILMMSACASYKAQKRAANQCDIDIDVYYLKELSVEQLECIESKGQGDPEFSSLSERIKAKKKELEQAETNKADLERRSQEGT